MDVLLIKATKNTKPGHHLHIKKRKAQFSNKGKTNVTGIKKHTKHRLISRVRNSNGVLHCLNCVENIYLSQKRFKEEYGQIWQHNPLLVDTQSTPWHTPASKKTPIRLLGNDRDHGKNHDVGKCCLRVHFWRHQNASGAWIVAACKRQTMVITIADVYGLMLHHPWDTLFLAWLDQLLVGQHQITPLKTGLIIRINRMSIRGTHLMRMVIPLMIAKHIV